MTKNTRLAGIMRQKLLYFKMMLIKGMKNIPFFLMAICIWAIIMSVSVYVISKVYQDSATLDRLQIAMCIPDDNNLTRLATGFMSGQESIESICEIEYMEADEALEGLQKGNIDVVIIANEDMVRDIYTGVNTPLTIYISGSTSGVASMFRQMAYDIVSVVQTTEAGIYASTYTASIYQGQMSIRQIEEYLTSIYVDYLLGRDKTYSTTTLSAFGSVDIEKYYISCFFLLIIGVLGLGFSNMYSRQEAVVERQLSRMGLGHWFKSIGRLMAMSITIWLACLVLLVCVACMKPVDIGVVELLSLFVLSMSVAAFVHMIFGICTESGSLVYVLCLVLMSLSTFVPLSFLPAFASSMARFMPLYHWLGCFVRIVWTGRVSLGATLLVTAICFLIGSIRRA